MIFSVSHCMAFRYLYIPSCEHNRLKKNQLHAQLILSIFRQNLKGIISTNCCTHTVVDCVWNVMAHTQKPGFVFRRNGRVHLNRRGRQFSRLLAAEVCASAVVILDTPCSEVVWRVLATHSNRQFHLHFPSRASPYAITFKLDSTSWWWA
jgi:hypothetical protein